MPFVSSVEWVSTKRIRKGMRLLDRDGSYWSVLAGYAGGYVDVQRPDGFLGPESGSLPVWEFVRVELTPGAWHPLELSRRELEARDRSDVERRRVRR